MQEACHSVARRGWFCSLPHLPVLAVKFSQKLIPFVTILHPTSIFWPTDIKNFVRTRIYSNFEEGFNSPKKKREKVKKNFQLFSKDRPLKKSCASNVGVTGKLKKKREKVQKKHSIFFKKPPSLDRKILRILPL